MSAEDKAPVRLAYARRNRDLGPQLVWRGKDEQDEADPIAQPPPPRDRVAGHHDRRRPG